MHNQGENNRILESNLRSQSEQEKSDNSKWKELFNKSENQKSELKDSNEKLKKSLEEANEKLHRLTEEQNKSINRFIEDNKDNHKLKTYLLAYLEILTTLYNVQLHQKILNELKISNDILIDSVKIKEYELLQEIGKGRLGKVYKAKY